MEIRNLIRTETGAEILYEEERPKFRQAIADLESPFSTLSNQMLILFVVRMLDRPEEEFDGPEEEIRGPEGEPERLDKIELQVKSKVIQDSCRKEMIEPGAVAVVLRCTEITNKPVGTYIWIPLETSKPTNVGREERGEAIEVGAS